MGTLLLLAAAFIFGVWFGVTRLGVWYALSRLGQAETRERRRRIRS